MYFCKALVLGAWLHLGVRLVVFVGWLRRGSSLLIAWHFCFREITCEPWELRLWENFLGRTNPSGGKKLHLSVFLLFLPDGAQH